MPIYLELRGKAGAIVMEETGMVPRQGFSVDETVLVLLLAGETKVRLSGEAVHQMISGSLLLRPAGVLHDQDPSGEARQLYWRMPASVGELVAAACGRGPELLRRVDAAACRAAWIASAQRLKSSGYAAALCALPGLILPWLEPEPLWLEQACQLLAEPEAAPKEVARKMKMSGDGFRRRFRQEAGRSPAAWRRDLETTRACELLQETPLALGEIARRLGFPDIHSFSRFFRRETGISPKAWRANSASPEKFNG